MFARNVTRKSSTMERESLPLQSRAMFGKVRNPNSKSPNLIQYRILLVQGRFWNMNSIIRGFARTKNSITNVTFRIPRVRHGTQFVSACIS